MVKNKYKIEYIDFVKEDMKSLFGVDDKTVQEKMAKSDFLYKMEIVPEYFMHFDSSIWAERIYLERHLTESLTTV